MTLYGFGGRECGACAELVRSYRGGDWRIVGVGGLLLTDVNNIIIKSTCRYDFFYVSLYDLEVLFIASIKLKNNGIKNYK
jgi:hypothetical protein